MKKNIIIYLLLLLGISDTLLYIANSGFGDTYFTPMSLLCKYIAVAILISLSTKIFNKTESLPASIVISYRLLLGWNVITIFHGTLTAQSYWDWKFLLLSSSLFLMIPLVFYLGNQLLLSKKSIYYFLRYFCLYGFFLIPLARLTNEELYARIMLPVTFLIVCLPYLKGKYRVILIVVAVTSVLSILDFRSNMIKMAIGSLVILTYYIRTIISNFVFKLAHAILFALPVVLLILAVFFEFNVFQKLSETEGYEVKTKAFEASNLAADTRTFLYVEVFQTINSNGSWFFGNGAAGKYKTIFFTDLVTGNMRYGTEVGFLNTLLYSGFLGVFFYLLILFLSSYFAIYKSNNRLSKMLGLIIASRWVLFFMEEFTQFDLNFYFLWLIIGLISTTRFRSLRDADLVVFFDFSFKPKFRNNLQPR